VIRIETHLGLIEVSENYFADIIGQAVSECFGVSGLVNTTATQSVRSLFSRGNLRDKGVRVRAVDGQLVIDLHIAVTYGVNISAIAASIVNKVSYTVEEASGMRVTEVNVFVEEMLAE